MKKSVVITIVVLLVIATVLGCWFVFTDSLDFNPNAVSAVLVQESVAMGGGEFTVTDPDHVAYITGALNRLILFPYTESYANGYYYELTLLDRTGTPLLTVQLRNHESVSINGNKFNANVKNLRYNLERIKRGEPLYDERGELALALLAGFGLLLMAGMPALVGFMVQLWVCSKLDRSVWLMPGIVTVAVYLLDRSCGFYYQVVHYLGLGISLDFYYAPRVMLAVILFCQGLAWHLSAKQQVKST